MITIIYVHRNYLKLLADRWWMWRHRERLAALQTLFMPEVIVDGKLTAMMPGPDGKAMEVDLTPKVTAQTIERAKSDAMKLAVAYLREHPELKFQPLASGRPLKAQTGVPVDLPAMIRNTSLRDLSKEQLDEKFQQQVQKAIAAGQQPPIAPVP